MTTISTESIAGIMNKTWNLSSLTVTKIEDGSTDLVQKVVNDLSSDEFIAEWGGYAPIQLTFYHNHAFDAIYQIDGETVKANGNWSISSSGITLSQSSGDNILLTNALLQGEVLSCGYEYLSSDYGINQLVFNQAQK